MVGWTNIFKKKKEQMNKETDGVIYFHIWMPAPLFSFYD